MKRSYYISDKTVINCYYCMNKLRVPVDKGRISVKCPVCNREFIFNPNSILHTLRQIFLSVAPRNPKARRNLIIILIAALIIITAFIIFFSGRNKPMDYYDAPGQLVYDCSCSQNSSV
ncbi:MAG: hypothetical protein ACOX7R_07540 [Acetivibrionales bacterium]|jgi:hypothetical protein